MQRLLPLSLLLVPLNIRSAEPLRMGIVKERDQIVVDWRGANGIYELLSRLDAAQGPWQAVSWPTRQTQAIVSSGRPGNASQPIEVFRVATRTSNDLLISDNAQNLIAEGRRIFRFDTFGDENFWGGALKLHLAIAGVNNGGIGPGVSPKTALAVGLKVDADALPANLVA